MREKIREIECRMGVGPNSSIESEMAEFCAWNVAPDKKRGG